MDDSTTMDIDRAAEEASRPGEVGGAASPPSISPQQHHNQQNLPPRPQQEPEQQAIINELEVDSNRSDNDSSLGSDISSISSTMRSEDFEFRFENGRRYQSKNAMYHLPNDIQEMDRLELQHLIWMQMLGGRHALAPLDQTQLTHVLDVGCGTGNWTIEFANLHPDVQVLGTDLSPIQPEWVPSNCSFFIDDATHDWSFHQRFDYVHSRALSMGIGDWDRFVEQAYDFLQPGGFIELQEFHLPLESPDGSLEGSALRTWGEKVRTICGRLGIDTMAALGHADRLRRKGFREVDEKHLLCPLGPWAKGQRQKRIGWMARKDLYEGIDAISKRLFLIMGDTEEEVDAFLEKCKEELLDPAVRTTRPPVSCLFFFFSPLEHNVEETPAQIHPCMSLDITWGQRPLES
ncbi:S-adenosyl-L-methionine-dependent methyltransferase [Biscogniauxia marginata]|nr:S-adenosyl-L-methionine-dependent methyltransferase [Biscogniauxia marginata]